MNLKILELAFQTIRKKLNNYDGDIIIQSLQHCLPSQSSYNMMEIGIKISRNRQYFCYVEFSENELISIQIL